MHIIFNGRRIYASMILGLFANLSFAALVSYEVEIEESLVNFTGEAVKAITLNDSIPGPVLEAQVGDTFRVTFINRMDVETSIHWHGVLLPNDQDGVPYLNTQPIGAHSQLTYEFPITHHGTYWYHSHTGLQEQRGVYGALVFHPENEKVESDSDQVLVFSDWTNENPDHVLRNLKRDDDYYALKKDSVQSWNQVIAHGGEAIRNRLNANWMRMGPMDISDVGYDAFLVNGQPEIDIDGAMPNQKVRLRMINASASTYQYIRFSGGPMQIVAADGVDVEPLWVDELTMAIAETYDVIVSVPDHRRYELRASSVDGTGHSSTWIGHHGDKVAAETYMAPNPYLVDHSQHDMTADMNHGSGHDMPHTPTQDEHSAHEAPMTEMSAHMEHDSHEITHMEHSSHEIEPPQTRSSQPSLGHYENLRALTPIDTGSDRPLREVPLRLTGNMDGYRWSFNDAPLSSADRILISRGERVRFVLQNETMMNHPIHLHGHFFRVITEEGEYSPIKHTVNVPSMQTVVIEFDADEEKDWIFHCHNLYHMKAGMSRVVRYDDFQGDPSLPSTIGKVMSSDNSYWAFADLGIASNVTELSTWMYNNRHEWALEAEYDWDNLAELEVSYAYRFNNFTQVFAGVDSERHSENQDGTTETLAVMGVRYLLPGMIDSELRVDEEGDLRLQLESEIRLTKHTELEWHWNTGGEENEYGVHFSYEPTKRWAITAIADSEFDTGVGIELRF